MYCKLSKVAGEIILNNNEGENVKRINSKQDQ